MRFTFHFCFCSPLSSSQDSPPPLHHQLPSSLVPFIKHEHGLPLVSITIIPISPYEISTTITMFTLKTVQYLGFPLLSMSLYDLSPFATRDSGGAPSTWVPIIVSRQIDFTHEITRMMDRSPPSPSTPQG